MKNGDAMKKRKPVEAFLVVEPSGWTDENLHASRSLAAADLYRFGEGAVVVKLVEHDPRAAAVEWAAVKFAKRTSWSNLDVLRRAVERMERKR